MSRRWTLCTEKKPNDEREILLAMPDQSGVRVGHWFEPEQAWVLAGTHIQVWPTFWRDMPPNPMDD